MVILLPIQQAATILRVNVVTVLAYNYVSAADATTKSAGVISFSTIPISP